MNKAGDLYNIISKSVSDVTGRNSPPEQATDGGTSDARYIKNYCEVVELGLRNQTLHKVDEFVFVEDIIKLENIYAIGGGSKNDSWLKLLASILNRNLSLTEASEAMAAYGAARIAFMGFNNLKPKESLSAPKSYQNNRKRS